MLSLDVDPTANPKRQARAYAGFIAGVEPRLMERPRTHVFAQPPLVEVPPGPLPALTVAVERGSAEGAELTRAALAAQTHPPGQVTVGDSLVTLGAARTGWVVLVAAGDRPAPRAMERIAQAAVTADGAQVITTDEDLLEGDRRVRPRLLPGPSPDLLATADLSTALMAVRRGPRLDAALAAGLGAAWRYRLLLALAGPDGLGHAHVPQILCHRAPGGRAPRPAARRRAAAAALDQAGSAAVVQADGEGHRVVHPVEGEPSVDVIILFRDKPDLLRRCVETLLTRSSWERLGVVLMDNGSTDPAMEPLLEELAADSRVRRLRDDRAFNFAALNNAAVATSEADHVVFLNNDTAVTDPGWVEELLREAARPEIGAVAPLLLFPDGTVQHAGAAIGMHSYAGHPFAGLDPATDTAFGRAGAHTRNWLAVTAACLMVERAKFDEVGGFDETFVVGGNDVDLCLRLTAAGYRSLCVPHTSLLHDESKSRGTYVDPGDFARSEQSYGLFRTVGDPFYNPNLTLARSDCSLRAAAELA